MDKTQQQINELQAQMQKLQSQVSDLSGAFYKNNFSSSQTFNKDCSFQSRLRVPVFTNPPAICEVGDLMAIAGILYICTVANTTWTKVGTQS